MIKDKVAIIAGKDFTVEFPANGQHMYYMDRGCALLHLLALNELSPTSDLEKEELNVEKKRIKQFIEMRWA
jgi:hypothetical protein